MMLLNTFEQLKNNEDRALRPYAVKSSASKGRMYTESDAEKMHILQRLDPTQEAGAQLGRLPFQKDRDRIMHSRAFRRLKGKTQVFVADYGDHFRTRLSHSIEVAQISRDIARTLGLNEDLAECIALAHDLGHTPFGHAGQDTLDELLRPYGLHFEHNEQSLRIVDRLENIYPHFRGLNLSHEVREGLMKHQTPWDNYGKVVIAHPSLEAQIVNLGDEIAYSNHDIDDGLRSGIITLQDLERLELWQMASALTESYYGKHLSERHFISRTISAVMAIMIEDVQYTIARNLQTNSIETLEDVYACAHPIADFSPELKPMNANLKSMLASKLYFSEGVRALSTQGQTIITDLFHAYMEHPNIFYSELEDGNFEKTNDEKTHAINVKDYIAGMTDEFATQELEKLHH